jgi:hypothetical protein
MSPSDPTDFQTAFQVAPDRIARLKDAELGRLMLQLLRAESYRCGAPVKEVRVNTEEKAADGGCDGWSGKPERTDGWLGDAETCWQMRAGRGGEKARIKGEIQKTKPRDALKKGGRFVLVASGSTNGLPGEKERLDTLIDEANVAGLPTNRIEVIGSERLASWCNEYPSIAALWANRPAGIWSIMDWIGQKEHHKPWQIYDHLIPELEKHREQLNPATTGASDVLHLHLHGPPGIGKTRLALEICRHAPWADLVAYVQRTSENNVLALLNQVAHEVGVRFVVVADQTPANLLMDLRRAVERSNGRIRLITIGDSPSPEPRRISQLEVPGLTEADLQQLVACWYPGIANDPVQIQYVAELAKGNPRIARLASDALDQDPALTPSDLRERAEILIHLERIFAYENQSYWRPGQLNSLISDFWERNQGNLLLEEGHMENTFTPKKKPIPSISVISLIVQARDTRCCDSNGMPLLDLIPEVQSWQSDVYNDDNNENNHLDLTPRTNVPLMAESTFSKASGTEYSLASCLFEWHDEVVIFTETLRKHKGLDVSTIIVELFLPHELLSLIDLEDLRISRHNGRKGREKNQTLSIASGLNLVVRSLDRAEEVLDIKKGAKVKASLRRRLHNENTNRDVLFINEPPPAFTDNPDDEWEDELFDRAGNDRTAACFYLADHPSEKGRMEDLLLDLVYSHLPLTLLWPRNFSIPAKKRLKFAQEILSKIGQQAVPEVTPQEGFFTQVQTCLSNLRLDTVACLRKEIMCTQDRELAAAAKRAILLMDVPDRWPRQMPASSRDHPEDRCLPPVQI